MTTLEEVFLHLERDEETECTMDNLSKKIVRNRALSRSLSLQSKSTSYQSLQNEGANIVSPDGKGITNFISESSVVRNIFDQHILFLKVLLPLRLN